MSATMNIHYWYAHKASFFTEAQAPWIPRPIEARQVLRNWTETEANRAVRYAGAPWNMPYLDLNNVDARLNFDDTKTISKSTHRGYIQWNITLTAKNWLKGQPNYGILLSAANEKVNGRDIRFYSREQSNNLTPYLEVVCTNGGKY